MSASGPALDVLLGFSADDLDSWPIVIERLARRLDELETRLDEHQHARPPRGPDLKPRAPRPLDAGSYAILRVLDRNKSLRLTASTIEENLPENVHVKRGLTSRLATLYGRGLVVKHERKGRTTLWQAAPDLIVPTGGTDSTNTDIEENT